MTGTTPPTSNPALYGGSTPFFKPTDLDAGYSVTEARQHLSEEGANYARILPIGTVLVTCIGATIGKTGLARVPCATNQQINAVIPAPSLRETNWLYWWFVGPFGQASIKQNASSTTLPILNKGRFSILSAIVSPLKEQRRIVDAIESYFTRLDDAVATLERVERNLKRYRASVLKAAVEGRLVPTEAALAKQEGRTYEPASVLLQRILAERRRRWSESGKKGKYQEPTPPDTTNLPDLPEGWCWATVDSLIWDADYGTSQKCSYEAKGPPVLRIPNVQEQALHLDDIKFATNPEELKLDGAVRVGDLIFIRTNGSRNLIGRGAIVLEEFPVPHHFASYLIRLRVLPIGAIPRWLGFAWHTPVLREQILADAASSAGQYNVSMNAATGFVVPLAPAAEQQRILQEVERIDSLAAATAATASAAASRSTLLRQAILKWAFDGRLADQDPADEPASDLLERIKTEREGTKPGKTFRAPRVPRVPKKKQVRA